VAVIVLVANEPCIADRVPELASEKLKKLALTARFAVVELLAIPDVPFTVSE
jgi:hypothetical protein